jgi:hypothetical protein
MSPDLLVLAALAAASVSVNAAIGVTAPAPRWSTGLIRTSSPVVELAVRDRRTEAHQATR